MEALHPKLYARLETIVQDQNIDEARILTEAAIFADKTAVDEETVRLRSHISQLLGDAGAPTAPWAASWTSWCRR